MNGDGYDDVIVGGPDWDDGETNEGAAWVYRGASTGVVDAPLWYRPSNQANARFGFSVGGAGDVNGDGYGDVIVGAPYYDEDHDNEGWAGVYYGSAEGLPAASNWHKVSRQDGAHFGWSVATAGDVNLDSFSDVIIGAPDWDDGQTDEGAAWIYRGASTGVVSTPLWYRPSNKTGSRFGYAVSTAGDVNGDSHSDVIIGAPMWTDGQDDEGGAFVYRGTVTGPTSPPIWSKQSDQAWAYFGQAVGCAGDVNGDGYADVVVGAYANDAGGTDGGRARLPRRRGPRRGGDHFLTGAAASIRLLARAAATSPPRATPTWWSARRTQRERVVHRRRPRWLRRYRVPERGEAWACNGTETVTWQGGAGRCGSRRGGAATRCSRRTSAARPTPR